MSIVNKSTTPITAMLVDDSAIIRSLIARILKESPDIEIVGLASDGQEAVQKCKENPPNIILLDIEMPVMDGLTAIPLLATAAPDAKIILCSALSEKGADITLRGLALGASDFILKPSALTGADNKDRFRDELLDRIYSITRARQSGLPSSSHIVETKPSQSFPLRTDGGMIRRPSIIAIGSSTGGPNALTHLFKLIKRPTLPIVITQHMPKTFTKILADQLSKCGETRCYEGEQGMEVVSGCAYVAPGDFHMTFNHDNGKLRINLNSEPPENFCRPAVDPMLRSLVSLYGRKVLTLILTGMGSDGLEGARQVVAAGGHILAQDEASSAVWGMPGAVAKAGLCSEVNTLDGLAERVQKIMDME